MRDKNNQPVGRLQSPKIFNISWNISTTRKDIGAYSIEHVESGMMYHGSTGNLYRRVIEHQKSLKNGTHRNIKLQEVFNDGGSLTLHFYPTNTREEAFDLEQRLMDTADRSKVFNSTLNARNPMAGMWDNPTYKDRFSKSRIGNNNALGTRHTDEWKEQARNRMLGNNHHSGHKHSAETRKKMSEAHVGRTRTPEEIRKSTLGRIRGAVLINGIEYESRAEAARVLGMSHEGVNKRCRSDNFPDWIFIPKE